MELSTDDIRVPVTIITGFLGSGKTTLLNHILSASHGKKIAVIENEFGDVSIDDELLAENTKLQLDDGLFEVLNGCLCCSVRTDLVDVLQRLAARRSDGLFLDAIVIETTGMAAPGPVAQTFLADPFVKSFCRLDGIITMVDARHIEQHLDEVKEEGAVNESVTQVAFADRLLLNKVDLVPDDEALRRIEARLCAINSFARIQRCQQAAVSVDLVLDIHGADLPNMLEAEPGFLDPGIVHVVHDTRVTSHCIDQGAARHLRTVGKELLDFDLVCEWFSELRASKGEDLYRMKGVLAIAHSEQKYVFHSVHHQFNGAFVRPWAPDEPRTSKLIFIGKDLDPEALDHSFAKCQLTQEVLEEKQGRLRFAVGERVECCIGRPPHHGWAEAEVVQLMCREEGMPPGFVSPYKIKLEDNSKVDRLHFIYADDDAYIRAPLSSLSIVSCRFASLLESLFHFFRIPSAAAWTRHVLRTTATVVARALSIRNESSHHDRVRNHVHADGSVCDDPTHDHDQTLASQSIASLVQQSTKLYRKQRHDEALAVATAAVRSALSYPQLGHSSEAHASALMHLASVQAAMRQNEAAKESLRELCLIHEGSYGERCLEMVPALHAMAEILELDGKLSEAAAALYRAREIRRTRLSEASLDYGFSCHNVAALLARQVNEDVMMMPRTRGALVERLVRLVLEAADVASSNGENEKAIEFIESVIEELVLGGQPNVVAGASECEGPLLLLKQRFESLTGKAWLPQREF